ncbi:Copia protein [Madurella mycetomatis]|uniref:Copia protein n=1 Tax=Madurella mycetomatis TaxID=100816 RepID=A0A175WFG1_9PEZI|nr:Copia protein [Madurella mycetomatis]
MTVLPSKWVYDEKVDPNTSATTARARWVVCGNFDQGSWDSQDVYAAVVNSVTVKTFFTLVAVQDLECYQFDFKTAFLNAPIPNSTEYYIEPPPGLGKPTRYICKLNKALYGLQKSPLYWFLAIKPVMESLGFNALSSDLCLFRHKALGVLVVLYVDDVLIAATTVNIINDIRDRLRAIYDLKEMGEVKRFLGFDVVRDRAAKKIFISQSSYIKTLLKKEPLTTEQKGYIKKTGSINWTRYIDIRYKWIIEQAQRGRLKISHIKGIEMAADGLTKPLLRENHAKFVRLLGMVAKKIPWAD